jgi:cysteine-rich repeat protein
MENGDNAIIPNYVLDVVYTPIVCGDNIVAGTEQCDDGNTVDGDGCSSTCVLEIVCGNGVLQAGEQCDDANTANNDGCSMTCTIENLVAEVEPNNTSADAMTNTVQITGDRFVSGAITPSGDVDRFHVTVATATTIRFETFTTWGNCATSTLDVRLFDSASNPITTDLLGAGIGECGAITIFLDAGTYFFQVEERGNNTTVGAYLLEVNYQTNDGTETEPNETTAQASTNLANKTDTFVFGDHMMAADVDVYAITVPPNARIRAEVIEGNRAAETCASGGVDARLTIFDDTGAVVAEDNDEGRGLCPLIDGTGATPSDPNARNASLVARTYYVMVRASAFAVMNNAEFVYRLQVTVR